MTNMDTTVDITDNMQLFLLLLNVTNDNVHLQLLLKVDIKIQHHPQ